MLHSDLAVAQFTWTMYSVEEMRRDYLTALTILTTTVFILKMQASDARLPSVTTPASVLSVEPITLKEESKCVSVEDGVLSVMIYGV